MSDFSMTDPDYLGRQNLEDYIDWGTKRFNLGRLPWTKRQTKDFFREHRDVFEDDDHGR